MLRKFCLRECEILIKFHENLCKIRRKMLKNSDFCRNFSKNAEKFDEFLLNFLDLSGAKDCKACSSRKMLQNEYLVATIGADVEENEPSKV